MKNLFVIILLILNFCQLFGQTNEMRVYKWKEVLFASPDTVYGISFAKLKLDSLPKELSKFSNLKRLDLKKNKLRNLPDFIADFNMLESISLEKNKLDYFPVILCRMPDIKEILIGDNLFETLPECISRIKSLQYLDLYDTPIRKLPLGLQNLENLLKIDLSGIKFSAEFQELWIKRMPKVIWEFDPPCSCMR